MISKTKKYCILYIHKTLILVFFILVYFFKINSCTPKLDFHFFLIILKELLNLKYCLQNLLFLLFMQETNKPYQKIHKRKLK